MIFASNIFFFFEKFGQFDDNWLEITVLDDERRFDEPNDVLDGRPDDGFSILLKMMINLMLKSIYLILTLMKVFSILKIYLTIIMMVNLILKTYSN